jgi:hypothetical protein
MIDLSVSLSLRPPVPPSLCLQPRKLDQPQARLVDEAVVIDRFLHGRTAGLRRGGAAIAQTAAASISDRVSSTAQMFPLTGVRSAWACAGTVAENVNVME